MITFDAIDLAIQIPLIPMILMVSEIVTRAFTSAVIWGFLDGR